MELQGRYSCVVPDGCTTVQRPAAQISIAHNLGFEGFGAFQKALFTTPAPQPGAFYLRQAQTALNSGDQPTKQRAAQLGHENQANIDRFVETFDPECFDRALDLIAGAGRVTIFGIRQFHSLAAFLAYGLRLIRSDVSKLDANALGFAEELAAMNLEMCASSQVLHLTRPKLSMSRRLR